MGKGAESHEYSPKHEEKLNYHGPLSSISRKVCEEYNLGNFRSNRIMRSGYEDFNMRLDTSKGRYFVKIFARHRNSGTPSVIVKAMELAMKAGVSTPKLHRSKHGYLSVIRIDGHPLKVCVTDFVNGRTFWESKEQPTLADIKFLAKQAAKINRIKYKLVGGSGIWTNSWSRVNLPLAFQQRGKYLTKSDRRLVLPAVREYKQLKVRALPRALAHVDMAIANVIKDPHGKLWIVDFSGAYNYPRIFELAFLAKSFMIGKTKEETEANIEIALKEYQKVLPLTKREIEALPVLIRDITASAILFFVSFNALFGKDVPEVNKEYLKLARMALRQLQAPRPHQ